MYRLESTMLRRELGGRGAAQTEQWAYTGGSRHQSSLGTQRCVPAAGLVSLKGGARLALLGLI